MKKYNVGLIGAGFMGKAHSSALSSMPMFFWPAPGIPVRKTIADVTLEEARDAAARYGYSEYTDDWRKIIEDPDIDVVDIVTPNNMHAEMAIAAAKAGKHILCEKPIARTTEEAKAMFEAVSAAGVKNMLAFNYRRTPAVALAKKFIDEGSIGKILSYRGTYLNGGGANPNNPLEWRFRNEISGYGVLGDIGTHAIDLARYLVGEFAEVNGTLKIYTPERPVKAGSIEMAKVTNDDEAAFSIRFKNGTIGTIEASRNAWGRNNYITFEIHGTLGSLFFNYERRDELQVFFSSDSLDRQGFRTIYTGPSHPYGKNLWPVSALGIGYSEIKIVECYEFFKAIAEDSEATPNFFDGYRISLICDAVARSSVSDRWEKIDD